MNKIFQLTPAVAVLSTLLVASPLLTGCATKSSKPQHIQGDNYAYTKTYMSKFIKAQMDEYDMVGVSVALVDASKPNPVVWARGFGYADKENKRPATGRTIFRAGSTVKLFTATAIMQLAEQGKLDIDKPIQTYLPKLTIRSRFASNAPVTIRNMLTHHSGMPSNQWSGMLGDETADFSDLADKTYDLAAPPNTQFSYSNLAFSLLGQVIENVSGMPYEHYIKQNLLTPMGMNQSDISKTLSVAEGHAKAYFNGKSSPSPALQAIPAGGLNTNVLDLAKFAYMTLTNGKARNGQQILPSKTLTSMQSSQVKSNSPFAHDQMGFGWLLKNKKNNLHPDAVRIAEHGGTVFQFNTAFKTIPKHKLAVVVMANGVNEAGEGTDDIATEMLKLALASKTGMTLEKAETTLPAVQQVDSADAQKLSGTWFSNVLGRIDIRQKSNGKLKIKLQDKWIDLVHRGNHKYYLQYKVLSMSLLEGLERAAFRYEQVDDQEVLRIFSPSNQHDRFAEQLTPQPLSPAWKKRLGSYTAVKGSGIFKPEKITLTHKDGLLALSSKMRTFYGGSDEQFTYLKLIDDNRAVTYGKGRNAGDMYHFKSQADGSETVTYSGFEFRK